MTPDLHTARLHLRPLVLSDAGDVTRLIGDFEVVKWLTMPPHPYVQADAEAYIGSRTEDQQVWAITRDGEFMGVIAIEGELGYWLGRPYWRQGIMSEAARAVVDHWIATTGESELRSGYMLGNEGSKAILTGLGFRDAGATMLHSRSLGAERPSRRMVLAHPGRP